MNRSSRSPYVAQERLQHHSSHSRNEHEPTAESSAEHRRKLEAMFGGSSRGLPAHGNVTREHREPGGNASLQRSMRKMPSKRQLRLQRLRSAREPQEIQEAADAFLQAGHVFPDDLDILYKLLQHPSSQVVQDCLGQIAALLMKGRINSVLLLDDRLGELAKRREEPAICDYVANLRSLVQQRICQQGNVATNPYLPQNQPTPISPLVPSP